MRALILALSTIALLAGCASSPKNVAAPPEPTRWFKGNTHTHTTRSDGDSEPSVVAAWYKEHVYDFLVLTDHNVLTDPAEADLKALQDDSFLLIPGEEISATFRVGGTTKPLHINGLGLPTAVKPVNQLEDIATTIQANIDAIRAAGGMPSVNHPNFRWAITHLDLLKLKDYHLLEIYNGHPLVNNNGSDTVPGMEKVWDILLSADKRIWGIAVDDAHNFKAYGPDKSNPGRGWVMVRAASLNADELLKNMDEGNFYFTTGVTLTDYTVTPKKIRIAVTPAQPGFITRTDFIGENGALLKSVQGNSAEYAIKGTEKYIRAKINGPDGKAAWTQPVFPGN